MKLTEEQKERINHAKKVQLICPNCKYEFQGDIDGLNIKINQIKKKKLAINNAIRNYKKLPLEKQKEKTAWRKRCDEKLIELNIQSEHLKFQRCLLREQVELNRFAHLKQIIQDFYGNDEFIRCINEMEERAKAYNIEYMMKLDFYSSSTGNPIKKI